VSAVNVAQAAALQGLCDRHRHGPLLGYARVSTADQQPHLQVGALERASCYWVFTEPASDARTDRTFEQVLNQLRPGDTCHSECDRRSVRVAATATAVTGDDQRQGYAAARLGRHLSPHPSGPMLVVCRSRRS
jgi:hypothetical protein